MTTYEIPTVVAADVFRAYDIRGPVDEFNLTDDLVYAIGLAIGSEAALCGEKTIIVGRDGRLSGSDFHAALCRGLCDMGCNVIDIGIVPTPVLYYATHELATNSGVMITASHNPGHHNGFKMVLKGKTVTTEGIQNIYQRILHHRFEKSSSHGHMSFYMGILDHYKQCIVDRIKLSRPLKVVIDCGNGVAGIIAPQLYRALGCEVIELYCDLDGHFPNHHPDPTVPENLTALIAEVKQQGADIGLAFDGDGDRLGVVTDQGELIWPDRQMMLFVEDVLARYPGAEIIFDVKCSRLLAEVIEQHGGKPLMCRTGHSLIKNKMLERDAKLAGEMSGHIFFRDEWFGFDDGLYVGARLLQILTKQQRSVSAIFAELPNSVNTPELKLPVVEADKSSIMDWLLSEADFGTAERITIDGLRVDFGFGWGLIRPSNTSPYLILRFEADSDEKLEEIKSIFRHQLQRLDADFQFPF